MIRRTVVCEEGGSHLVERTKSGGFVSRREGIRDNVRIETIGRDAVSGEDVEQRKHDQQTTGLKRESID